MNQPQSSKLEKPGAEMDQPQAVRRLGNGVEIEFHRGERGVLTRFTDGTQYPGTPHFTAEYTARTVSLGLNGNWQQVWLHEWLHSWLAEKRGEFSYVLWELAHGREPNHLHANIEEGQVIAFQTYMRTNRWAPMLNTLKIDFAAEADRANREFEELLNAC